MKKRSDEHEDIEYEIIEADLIKNFLFIGAIVLTSLIFFVAIIITCVSCTITMENVSTHGTAGNVANDTITPTEDISADIPISATR